MKRIVIALVAMLTMVAATKRDDDKLQRQTIATMRDWGVAFAAGKHPDVPLDGWGHRLRVTTGANGGYTLRSAGSDGTFDEKVWPGAIETPDRDLVYSNGNYVTFPGHL
jgi:hypothetical protein